MIYKISKAILIHRNGTCLEDIYLIDSDTGEIFAQQTHPLVPNEVYYDNEMNENIKSREIYSLISIHNHGTNIPPTGSDFVSSSLIDKRVEKYKQKRYNLGVKDAHLKALEELNNEYGIEWKEL